MFFLKLDHVAEADHLVDVRYDVLQPALHTGRSSFLHHGNGAHMGTVCCQKMQFLTELGPLKPLTVGKISIIFVQCIASPLKTDCRSRFSRLPDHCADCCCASHDFPASSCVLDTELHS